MNIKNTEIKVMFIFLDELKLKGKPSISRTKLKEGLGFLNEAFGKDQTAIVDEFDAWVDEEKTQFSTKNKELVSAMEELSLKEVTLNLKEVLFIEDLKHALDAETFNVELSGQEADMYALLIMAFEDMKEEK